MEPMEEEKADLKKIEKKIKYKGLQRELRGVKD